MAAPTRTVRVKFDGSARGLVRAAKTGGKAVKDFQQDARNSMASLDLAGSIGDALAAIPAQMKGIAIVAGAVLGAAFAPAVASAVIAGVLMAVGGAGLAAGIIGAARNPRVQNAWKKFADQAGKTFDRFSAPFVSPMIRAADTFRSALKRAEPTIVAIGRTLAPIIDKLAPAFTAMAERALPGILAAASAAVPLFDILGAHMPLLGDAVSGFFTEIANGSPGAQAFFSNMLTWVEGLLPKLGGMITWLSNFGTSMAAFAQGPDFTALKTALTTLKDDTLAGVKQGFDNIKFSVEANSATWRQLGQDIAGTMRTLGPVVKWLADLIGVSIGAAVDWFATLYNAIGRVWTILSRLWTLIKSILTDASRLPGNLSGGNTHASFGDLPGRAGGGSVQPFQDYLVGEEGPEVLRMGATGGTVIPNDKLGTSSSAPIIIENHIEVGGEVVRVVRTEIREHSRGVKRLVVAGAGAR